MYFQAPNKDAVHKVCQEAFLYRNRGKVPDTVLSNIASTFEIKLDDAKKVGNNAI